MNEYYAKCRYTKQGSLVKLDSSSKCLFHCLILKANIEKCILEINFLDTFWIISSSKAARTYPEMQMLGNQNVLTCDYYRRLKIVLTEYTNFPPKNWIWNHFKNVGQKFAVRKCILEYIYTFFVKGEKTMLEDSLLCRVLLLIRTINIILCVGTNNIFFFLSKLIYFDHQYDSWYFEWTEQRKRCSFFQHKSFNLKVV